MGLPDFCPIETDICSKDPYYINAEQDHPRAQTSVPEHPPCQDGAWQQRDDQVLLHARSERGKKKGGTRHHNAEKLPRLTTIDLHRYEIGDGQPRSEKRW